MRDVVQFNESHKWCGCFGFVSEVKGERYMIGVPVPMQGIAYIYCTKDDIDFIGKTNLVLAKEGEEEDDNN